MANEFFKFKLTPADAAQEKADIDLMIDSDLIERRKFVRAIPVPEAIEHDDEDSWSTWNELMAQQVQESATSAAIAKLKKLLHRGP